MRPKTLVLLAIAVGSGLLAMLGVQQAMSGTAAQQEEMVKVLVALRDIEVGEEITEAKCEFRELPISALPSDPVTRPEQYEERSPLYTIAKDSILRISELSEKGAIGKSVQIPHNMRVVAIPVDDSHTQSGMLQPKDRVDIGVIFPHRDKHGRTVTDAMTLMEYVEVFATDDRTAKEVNGGSGDSKGRTRIVSLLVTPEQVNYLRLAESKGKLTLAWRARTDDQIVNVGAVNEELLRQLKESSSGLSDYGPHYNSELPPLLANDPSLDLASQEFQDTPEEPQPQDVHGFLQQQESVPAEPVAVIEPQTPKNVWKMEIHCGRQIVTEEFELPEELELPEEPQSMDEAFHELDAAINGSNLWDLLKLGARQQQG